MKAVIVGRPEGACGQKLSRVEAGLRAHGIEVERTIANRDAATSLTDFAVCWGWRRGSELQRLGHRVLCVELGYIGDRGHWTSLAWDGLNGRGSFCLTDSMPPRFDGLFSLAPWKRGEIVLIMGQVPGDMSLQGRSLDPWYRSVKEASKVYGLPIVFRPHPRAIQRGIVHPRSGESVGPLKDDLVRAAVVITFNSNSAVDAVLSGVPAVTMDPGSMAWEVTGHAIGDLVRPAREEWANRLSWCQWSPEELESGIWWERLGAGLQ